MTTNSDGVVRDLTRMTQAGPDTMAELHRRLATAAARDGLLDIAYRTIDSPVGPLLLAATEEGLVRVAYAREDHDAVLAQLAERISPRILYAPARLDVAARELDEYFTGTRRTFDLPLDWRLAAGFRSTVLHPLAGSPKAVRAVGTACAKNPLPVVIPCHRVVRSDGAMGGYLGGPEAKRLLLDLEAAA